MRSHLPNRRALNGRTLNGQGSDGNVLNSQSLRFSQHDQQIGNTANNTVSHMANASEYPQFAGRKVLFDDKVGLNPAPVLLQQ